MGVKPLTLRSTSVPGDGSEGAMSAPAPGGRRLVRHLSADQLLESSPAAGSADGSTSAKSDDKIWRPMFCSNSELEKPEAGEEEASFEERKAQVLLTLLPPEQLRDMRVVFDMFDDDGGGTVSTAEVGITLRRQKLVASRKMLRTILAAIDVNGDGEIDFGEFVTLMTQRSKVVEHDVDEDDGEEPPGDLNVTASPRTLEAQASPRQPKAEIQDAEEQAQAIRQFKRAISHLAFGSHMTSSPTSPRAMEELDRVKAQLGVKKEMRTEWELQRVLIWMERFEFIQELPPAEDSDQRIDACRVLGVQEFEPGDRSVPSTRLALVLCLFWAWRLALADGAFPQDLP